jgi:hypothetical protein
MTTVMDVLSKVSGIPQSEIKTIFAEVQANHKRLESCVGPHDFIKDGKKFVCLKCNGSIDFVAHSWYQKGLSHGKR